MAAVPDARRPDLPVPRRPLARRVAHVDAAAVLRVRQTVVLQALAAQQATSTTTTVEIATAIQASSPSSAVAVIASDGNFPCGGGLYPPCYVAQRESGNTYGAYNPNGCGGGGCFGRWQFDRGWGCHWGLPCDIAHWTPAEQDYAARMLWAGGAGCGNWAAC